MPIDIRLPQINDTTEKGQLSQIKSYLYQLAEQLQWALNNADTSNGTVVVSQAPKTVYHSSSSSSEAQFSAIKPLIIKSAEIVEAYYEEINKRLVGLYVAESDFGTFQQATEHNIETTSTSVTNMFGNVQEISDSLEDVKAGFDADIKRISKAIDNINYSLAEANAYIKSGLLYYDDNEMPVYGLEVGQRNVIDGVEVFNKYARFMAGRLSFYDQNGNEVAYISDYKLYITHAEITGSLKLGGYLVDTSSGLTFKWVGRG